MQFDPCRHQGAKSTQNWHDTNTFLRFMRQYALAVTGVFLSKSHNMHTSLLYTKNTKKANSEAGIAQKLATFFATPPRYLFCFAKYCYFRGFRPQFLGGCFCLGLLRAS